MLRDVEFFESRLGKIDGFEDAGDYLRRKIRSKRILAPEPVVEPTPTPLQQPEPVAPAAASNGGDGTGNSAQESSADAQNEGAAAQAEQNGDSNGASQA